MLIRLAAKNMGKNIRDYGVYFLTLVFSVCIFYMFNSIYAQRQVMEAARTLDASVGLLSQMMSILSVFAAVILGGLIVYANHFFIRRRKKELGIYMTLGMSRGKISAIMLLETSFMALAALIVGLIAGVFLSQFMSVFTASVFEADMSDFKFIFSADAVVKSVLYFILMFVFVALFNIGMLRKYKLIDLIYGSRKNEEMRIENARGAFFILGTSILCLAAAYIFVLKNGLLHVNGILAMSIGLGIVGTLLFFLALSRIMILLVQSDRRIYYYNLNMFIVRQIASKINTNFISISVVCIVLFLVIGIFSSGYSMQHILSRDLREGVVYDFSLFNYSDADVDIYHSLPETIKQEPMEYHEFRVYNSGENVRMKDFSIDFSYLGIDGSSWSLEFILESDYNAALKMLGKEEIVLDADQYRILVTTGNFMGLARQIVNGDKKISLNGMELWPDSEIMTTPFSNSCVGLYFIVSDETGDALKEIGEMQYRILNLNCKDENAESIIRENLESINEQNTCFQSMVIRTATYEGAVSMKAIVAFLAMYLGIVFMLCCAAILAIQQLSEAEDNRQRYELLRKVGADDKMIERALFVQTLFYFALPLSLAAIHSVVGLAAVNELLRILGNIQAAASIFATAVFITAVYGAYFVLTFVGSKNIVNRVSSIY